MRAGVDLPSSLSAKLGVARMEGGKYRMCLSFFGEPANALGPEFDTSDEALEFVMTTGQQAFDEVMQEVGYLPPVFLERDDLKPEGWT